MKSIFLFMSLLIGSFVYSQVPEVGYVVPSISSMKTYFGNANLITVTGTNQQFVLCSPCTADETTVYLGAGGRKWRKLTHLAEDITNLNSAIAVNPTITALQSSVSSKASTAYVLAERTNAAPLTNKYLDFSPSSGNVAVNIPPRSSFNKDSIENFDPATKQDKLIGLGASQNIATINGQSILQSIDFVTGVSSYGKFDTVLTLPSEPTTGGNTYFNSSTHKLGIRINKRWLYFTASDSTNITSQNLITFSEEIDNVSYTKLNGGSVQANTAIAPDGTLTADTYTSGVGAFGGILRKPFVYSNGTYVASVYLKKNGWAYYGLRVGAAAGNNMWGNNTPYINLANNQVFINGAPPGTSIEVQDAGNGWVRLIVTFIVSGANGNQDYLDLVATDGFGDDSWSTTGTEKVYVWGEQLNTGSIKTYTKTTNTIVP